MPRLTPFFFYCVGRYRAIDLQAIGSASANRRALSGDFRKSYYGRLNLIPGAISYEPNGRDKTRQQIHKKALKLCKVHLEEPQDKF